MIANDFIYCKPETKKEAVKAYIKLNKEYKNVYYYGGGSEIITMARAGSIVPEAVIDLKGISGCNTLEIIKEHLVIGGVVTLNTIHESKFFPLLGTTGARIADHTNQCRITIGGNLCGSIIYRETALPLLLADATIILYGPRGYRIIPFYKVFNDRLQLKNGEFVYQIKIKKEMINAKFTHIKKTANEKIDYPLVSVCCMEYEDKLRFAFSGICPYPFRSMKIEEILNDSRLSLKEKLKQVNKFLPTLPITDYQGSGEYRIFVLDKILENILERKNDDSVL